MDACRAKLNAFGVAFGTERDRAPYSGNKGERVLIIAFQGTKSVSASTPPPQPTLILHLANHGHVPTTMYNLDPDAQADYYVTVQNAAGAAQWTMWRVPKNNNGSVTSVSGLYSLCQPASTSPWAYSIADFATCANAPHLQQGAVKHASLGADLFRPFAALISLLQPASEDPGWFSCDGGCCSMSAS